MAFANHHAAEAASRSLPDGEDPGSAMPDTEAGRTWWSRRFVELLESFGLGSRLERGREYARAGHVLELDVEPGIVLAKVQGTRFTPYRVRIRPQTFSEHQWRRAEKAIAAQALTLARLLAGEMPGDIEEVLAGAKLALLPSSYDELRASCTCPDDANPCKHTAAVYYGLAAHLDADPFGLFALRGRTREELLDALRARRARAAGSSRVAAATDAGEAASPHAPPLSDALTNFWRAGPELADLQISPLAGAAPDALLRRLGPLSTHDGCVDLHELLGPAYARLAEGAERRALSD
ncbi:MAG TPA: SWIM zinc finger family protein [Solirubrobacteraceae bacterium]|nr:SWIM zinc finger family protein [Solirubrobacteraceae bacterium]